MKVFLEYQSSNGDGGIDNNNTSSRCNSKIKNFQKAATHWW